MALDSSAAARAAPATGPAPGGTLAALAELRLRLLLRRFRGRGGIPELVARISLYVVAVPAGVLFAVLAGMASFQAVRSGTGLRATLPAVALFYGVWQTWTAVSLSLNDRDALDLRRFLGYPLPPGRVYGWGLVASVAGDPFAIFWCFLLGGAFLGALFGRPGAWILLLAVVHAGFVASTAAMVALLQELLARLVRGRRLRELAIAAVYVGLAFLLAWSSGAGRGATVAGLQAFGPLRWLPFPAAFAGEATQRLYAGRAWDAVPWALANLAAAAVAGWVAFRLALADARAGGEGSRVAGAPAGRGWRLPGAMGALVEKELKYVLRHPLTSVLLLVVPALAAFVGWRAAPAIPVEAGEVVRAVPLLGFALYAHLATQVFWLNAFGWDRGGARLIFLAPVDPADVILAKNLAAYAVSFVLFAGSAAALFATAGRPPAWAVVAAVALHAGIAPVYYSAGNLVSILNPRAASHTIQRGGRLSPLSGLAGMGIVSGGAALFALPVWLAIRWDLPWLLAGAWLAIGAAAGVAFWRVALPRTARLLAERREPLLDAVAGGDEA